MRNCSVRTGHRNVKDQKQKDELGWHEWNPNRCPGLWDHVPEPCNLTPDP